MSTSATLTSRVLGLQARATIPASYNAGPHTYQALYRVSYTLVLHTILDKRSCDQLNYQDSL